MDTSRLTNRQHFEQVVKRQSSIDDVFDNDAVLAFNGTGMGGGRCARKAGGGALPPALELEKKVNWKTMVNPI